MIETTEKTPTDPKWLDFESTIFRPQNLDEIIDARDLPRMRKYLTLRDKVEDGGGDEATRLLREWSDEVDRTDKKFFDRTAPVLNAVDQFIKGRKIRPGQKSRGTTMR